MLFSDSIQRFHSYMESKDYAETTINGYMKQLKYFRRWIEDKYNGPVYLDEIDLTDLDDYLLYRKDKGDKTASRSRVGYILKSFYKFVARKELGENLALDLEPVQPRKKERDYLTEDEYKEVLEEIEKPLIRSVTIAIYYTGARISECLNLKLEDLDFKNQVVHIKRGKGNKDRKIAMNGSLKKELQNYIQNIRPKSVDSDYLFATARSGSLSRSYYNRRLKKAVERAGVKKDITAHCLRHSMAVSLVQKGVDLPTIRDILGHESLKTTSIYVHSDMTQMRDALEAI